MHTYRYIIIFSRGMMISPILVILLISHWSIIITCMCILSTQQICSSYLHIKNSQHYVYILLSIFVAVWLCLYRNCIKNWSCNNIKMISQHMKICRNRAARYPSYIHAHVRCCITYIQHLKGNASGLLSLLACTENIDPQNMFSLELTSIR